MSYKIKRPISETYIALSDRIERMLDYAYKHNIQKDSSQLKMHYEIMR